MVSQHALQVSRPTSRGKLSGLARGSPSPHPMGKLSGLAWGGLQAHTQGGECIPACTEADSPTATAAGGTYPTEMHSCCCCESLNIRAIFWFTEKVPIVSISSVVISSKLISAVRIRSQNKEENIQKISTSFSLALIIGTKV